jgi:RHS repeat-associated protein
MTYPSDAAGGDGETVTYTYLPQGPLDRVSGTNTYVNNSYFDQAGRLYYQSLNNASDVVATTYTFFGWSDANGWGRLQSYSDNLSYQNLSYTYDANGNVRTISDAVAGSPQVQTYTYDSIDRIYSSITTGGIYGDEIYRNYFYETTTGNMNQNGFLIMEYDGVHKHAFTRGYSSGTPASKGVTVRARATSSTLAWPSMKLYVNGVEKKTWTVNSTAYANYTTTVPLTGKDYIDVVYTNDTSNQNLYVDYVTVDTKTVQAEGGAAILDSGTGTAAFDGQGVTPGQELLSSNASLRFVTGTNTFSGGYDTSGNLAHRVVLDKAFFFTYDAENRLTGVSGGTTASYLYNGLGQLIYSEDDAGTTYYVGEYFEMYIPAAGGQALIGGEASTGEGENEEGEPVGSVTPAATVTASPSATGTKDGTPQPSATQTQEQTLEPSATVETTEPPPTPTAEGTWEPSPMQTAEATPEPSPAVTEEETLEPAPTQTGEATIWPTVTETVDPTTEPKPVPEATVLLSDDFEHEDNKVIGEGWVEAEQEGAEAGIESGRLCFLDTSEATNRPIVARSFSPVSSGKLLWQFDFDWQAVQDEKDYALLMQLGEGALMDQEDPQAGIGVDLVWTNLDGAGQTLAYRTKEDLVALQTLSGPATIIVRVDLEGKTYSISIDGIRIANDIHFANQVQLDTVRFLTSGLDETNYEDRCFDNVEISIPLAVEGQESSGILTLALAGLRNTFINSWRWLGGQLATVRQALFPSIVHAAPPAGAAFRSYYFAGNARVAMRVEVESDLDNDELYFFLRDHLGSTTVTLKRNVDTGVLEKVGELRYNPWGKERGSGFDASLTPTDYRFTDQRIETSFGLYHYDARWFDPTYGRFVQADTVIPNPYNSMDWDRYVGLRNNPVRYTDPTGHLVCSDKHVAEGDCSDEGAALWRFGITIDDPDEWSESDLESIREAAFATGRIDSGKRGGDPWSSFRKAHGDIQFSMETTSEEGWSCERTGNGVSCYNANGSINPGVITHEFGHVFNANMENSGLASPYDELGASTVLDANGNWVEGINSAGVWQRTFDGYVGDIAPYVYHGREFDDWNTVGEEFADMYMNYIFNAFTADAAGAARYNLMDAQLEKWLALIP